MRPPRVSLRRIATIAVRAALGWCALAGLAERPARPQAAPTRSALQRNLEDFHREAVRRKEGEFGKAHPTTANALRDLGLLLLAHGRPEEAEPHLRDAWSRRQSVGPPDPLELARDAFGLAQTLRLQGEDQESEAFCGIAVERLAAADAADPDLLAEALLLHAALAAARGDLRTAARRYAAAIEARPDPSAMLEYADTLGALGDRRQSEAVLAQALQLRVGADERPHPQAGEILHRLALLAAETGDFAKARTLLQRARRAFAASSGTESAPAAAAADTFGNVLRALGELDEAAAVLTEALEVRRRTLGPRHPEVAATLNNLAGTHHLAQRLSQAEPLYRQAIAILSERFGPNDPLVAEPSFNLGYLLLARGDRTAAAMFFRRTVAILEAAGAGSGPLAADARAALATAAGR